jgi:hypothetical protein
MSPHQCIECIDIAGKVLLDESCIVCSAINHRGDGNGLAGG